MKSKKKNIKYLQFWFDRPYMKYKMNVYLVFNQHVKTIKIISDQKS